MRTKRLTLFAGHYGSGKTNVAVNYAIHLCELGYPVTIVDLDIVNPYFRTKDSAARLAEHGVAVISSQFAGSNLDAPAMPKEVSALLADRTCRIVLDIGGDDRGALALGRYVPEILAEDDYEMLLVINRSRPLTRTAEDTLQIMQEIESACHLPFTAIVHNTNLGRETTASDVLAAADYAKAVSEMSGLPIKMTTVRAALMNALSGNVESLFPLQLQELYYEIRTEDAKWQS